MKNKLKNYKVDVTDLDWKTGQVKGFLGKEFIQLSNGGVKLIKIDPMSVYPEHLHPDKTEYAYVVSGNPEFSIDNEYFIDKSGDFFIFPCNVKHSIKSNTVVEGLVLIGSINN